VHERDLKGLDVLRIETAFLTRRQSIEWTPASRAGW